MTHVGVYHTPVIESDLPALIHELMQDGGLNERDAQREAMRLLPTLHGYAQQWDQAVTAPDARQIWERLSAAFLHCPWPLYDALARLTPPERAVLDRWIAACEDRLATPEGGTP